MRKIRLRLAEAERRAELNSQIPEATFAKLPVRLCGRWAEFVEGNRNGLPGSHLRIG